MGISSLKVFTVLRTIIYKMIAACFALLCLSQVALGASEAQFGYPGQFGGQYPGNFYSGDNSFQFQMRPEDQSAINQLGNQGVQTGATGPVVRNGEIQTKWGSYALPNPQDAETVDRLLQATRDLIAKMTVNV